jgi:hypothetical protein
MFVWESSKNRSPRPPSVANLLAENLVDPEVRFSNVVLTGDHDVVERIKHLIRLTHLGEGLSGDVGQPSEREASVSTVVDELRDAGDLMGKRLDPTVTPGFEWEAMMRVLLDERSDHFGEWNAEVASQVDLEREDFFEELVHRGLGVEEGPQEGAAIPLDDDATKVERYDADCGFAAVMWWAPSRGR